MSVYKRFALIFACFVYIGLPLCFLALCALLWLYDPLQVWHKPYFRDISFLDETRLQNKGIIKYYDFNSFVLGSSMLRNTSAKEASMKLNGKWVNISMDGSAFNERAVVLAYLFKHKKVSQILYSLDGHRWQGGANTKNFDFLYDDGEFNDIKIYFNRKTILCALRLSTSDKCVGRDKDLEILTNWARKTWSSARFGGFHKWLENKDNEQLKDTLQQLQAIAKSQKIPLYNETTFNKSIKESQEMLEKNILSFVRKHPETKFYFVFPTYSRLSYRLQPAEFLAKTKIVLKWLLKQSQNLPNMKIYAFDDLNYADEIANYKDLTHYNVDMNSMQIDAIANGTHILTPENIDEYLQTMENKIKAYDLAPLIREIKEWEKNQNDKK